jgi:LysM repeat protein
MPTQYIIQPNDTLSQLALDNKTTVADLQKANPNIVDPNKIYAGQTLNLQTTTTAERLAATANAAKFDKYNGGSSTPEQKPEEPTSVSEVQNADGTITKTLSDGTTRVEQTPTSGVYGDLQAKTDETSKKYKAQIDSYTSQLDLASANLNESTKRLIEGIKATAMQRVKIHEDINSRLIGGKEQSNIRSGRSRYTQQIADGVISDEEQQGADRISDIYSRMNYEIAQAEAARDKGQLDIFNQKMSTLDKLNDNMNTEIGNLNTLAMDKLKELRDQQKQTASDQLAQKKAKSEEAKAIAGGIATSVEGYSDDEMAQLIGELAKTRGLDPLELLSQVTESMNDQQKAELDLQNIESQIIAREQGTQIDRQRENRLGTESSSGGSGAKGFKPTSSELSAVKKYLASTGEMDLLDGVLGDEQAFYELINEIEDTEKTEKDAEKQYLDEDYIKMNIDDATLQDLAEKAGYRKMLSTWGTEKSNFLDYLNNTLIPKYRKQGLTDKEIEDKLTK